MTPPSSKCWTTDPEYIDLLNYVIEKTKDAKSPMSIRRMAGEFKEKSGAAESLPCFQKKISELRTRICSFEHIDKKVKVQLLFALSAPVNAGYLKELKKDALVEVDEKKRITYYKANDGNLELNGDHSQSAKIKTTWLESKGSPRSWINSYFKYKNDGNVVPKNEKEKEIWKLIEFITEKCENVSSPLTIRQLIKDFNKHFGLARARRSINRRVEAYCREIQTFEFLDTPSKVKQLFSLSATLDSDCLEKLRKDAVVDVDNLNRITKYAANDGSLTLHGDHSHSAKIRTAKLASKRSHRSLINNHFEKKNEEVLENEEDEEMGKLIDFVTEKCENVSSPLSINRLTREFNKHFGIARSSRCINTRVKRYCHEIQKFEFVDTHSKVRQLFCLSAKLDSDFLEELRKDAAVEVDHLNRITKYTANDGRLILSGDHSHSAKKKSDWIERKKKKTAVEKNGHSGGNKDEDSEEENGYSEEDSEFDSDDENDPLEETEDLMEPSNEEDDLDNETPARNRSPTEISIDDNFDFDPPTERSHASEEIEMREDDEKNDPKITGNAAVKTQKFETLPKSQTSSNTSHTPKTPKRKAVASDGSSTTKRTKQLPEESMNSGNSNGNISHDDPPRVESNPFHEPLGLPDETQKDADIQQIPKPRPQVMEAPIKKEYEEESQSSLKTILKSFKSLILGLDTTGLSQLQTELNMKIEKTGRGIEVSNKEVIMAMELFIVKLSKHGALKCSEEAISLHDILLILRTIILNSSFKDLEDILKMLKENIDQLKVMDKKVPVSKVDSVLRATIDSIST